MGVTRVHFDQELGCVVVPDGACPFPIGGDDGTVKQCLDRHHCGCDELKRAGRKLDGVEHDGSPEAYHGR